MARYRVSRRETIVHKGNFIKAGSELPDGVWTQKEIDAHVASGLLVVIGSDRDNESNDTGADRQTKAIKHETEDEGRALRTTDKPGTPVPENLLRPEDRNQPGRTTPTPNKGRWTHDPASLKGKSLKDLNTMVIEIDHNINPFDTKEEAIAQLSMDLRS